MPNAALQLTFLTGYDANSEPITKTTSLKHANAQLTNEQLGQIGNSIASLVDLPVVDITLVRYYPLAITSN